MPSPPPSPSSSAPEWAADPVERGLSDLARLVAECLERVDSEGPAAIDAVCARHPEHADELRSRLAGLRDLGLLNQGRIGPYRLLKTLGQGGMGLVYLAFDERLDRVVALKALPSSLALNPRALARFEREVRAAAQLRHPRLVPIHDVGEADGVPYFTMEYVEGLDLAQALVTLRAGGRAPAALRPQDLAAALRGPDAPHGPAAMLSNTATPSAAAPSAEPVEVPESWGGSHVTAVCRLALDVADALDHAHEHGVIHRDVKPSNVLVRRDGRALLSDFGLARVEHDVSLSATSDFTGTPSYVSPEQIEGRREDVDRRSDVYSLGVTLYELLTLTRPFDGRTTQEVFRQILTREPELPRRLNPAIPRDLETVVLTAMEKDPARRYQSAAELAADLRRFLAFEPVVARPVGALTRGLRWVRRHRALSVATVLALVLAIGTPWLLWRSNAAIRSERDAAARQADAARAAAERATHMYQRAFHINQVLLDLFEAPAARNGGVDVTVAEVLDTAAATLAERLADDPIIEASVRNGLGNAYMNLGLFDAAETQWLRARDLAEGLGDAVDVEVLADAYANLGVAYNQTGRIPEAGEMLSAAVATFRGLFPGAHFKTAAALNNLSYVHIRRGDFAGALTCLEESLAMRRELSGAVGREVIESLVNLAYLAGRAGDKPRSQAMLDEALDLARQHLPADDPLTATILRNRGLDLATQAAALSSGADGHEREQRADEAAVLRDEARGLLQQGEAMLRESLAMQRASLGDGHRSVAEVRIALALILRDLDDQAGVIALLEPAVASLSTLDAGGSAYLGTAKHRLGEALFGAGQVEAAETELVEALEMLRAFKPDTDRSLLELGNTLTDLLQAQDRHAEALTLLWTYQPDFEAAGARSAAFMASLFDSLADVCRDAGWSEQAADFEARRDALAETSPP